ncbi:hypothetical protein EV421DRAFT_1733783 [Armillaria borealis]|uniref:Uncharacterized protein n=1 Tax=Armillaria borealis TaxID=47425 RepID=A0AA39JQU6_9AGAR|nr:hypothetical protein EV421DRAFT_1733783 [Armillaria borealis]
MSIPPRDYSSMSIGNFRQQGKSKGDMTDLLHLVTALHRKKKSRQCSIVAVLLVTGNHLKLDSEFVCVVLEKDMQELTHTRALTDIEIAVIFWTGMDKRGMMKSDASHRMGQESTTLKDAAKPWEDCLEFTDKFDTALLDFGLLIVISFSVLTLRRTSNLFSRYLAARM